MSRIKIAEGVYFMEQLASGQKRMVVMREGGIVEEIACLGKTSGLCEINE